MSIIRVKNEVSHRSGSDCGSRDHGKSDKGRDCGGNNSWSKKSNCSS